MPRPAFQDLLTSNLLSVSLLWDHDQQAQALVTLDHLLGQARKQNQFALIGLQMLEQLNPEVLQNLQVSERLGFALCRGRQSPTLRVHLENLEQHGPLTPGLRVLQAWCLVYLQNETAIAAALELLEAQQGKLSGWHEGLRLRLMGECLAFLKKPGWERCFAAAKGHLSGVPLGLCLMEEGTHAFGHGEAARARGLWAEALPHLREDPYYHAWVRYNLGVTTMGTDAIEAERHFLELEQLRHLTEAREFAARAWQGLGSARRVLGELGRAKSCYREALKLARDFDDREQALWGLGRTLVQAGNPTEGLGYLREAYEIRTPLWLRADLAIGYLRVGELSKARAEVADIDLNNGKRSGMVARLVLAELARLEGNLAVALTWLQDLDFEMWHLKEDKRCFQDLLDWGESQGLPHVPFVPVKTGNTVQVKAEGVLQVQVNGRRIPIKPTSKTAEVLVRLLEKDGQDTLEGLQDALFRTEAMTRRQVGQALWNHIKKLRQLLGWEESVLAPGGAFMLDPETVWQYDIAEARLQERPVKAFLEGIYSEWVLETQQDLQLD